MPIFEYTCVECGKITEKLVPITDIKKLHDIGAPMPEKMVCEHCNGEAIRIMSTFSFNFKGGAPTKRFY